MKNESLTPDPSPKGEGSRMKAVIPHFIIITQV